MKCHERITPQQGRLGEEIRVYWPTDPKEKIIFALMACKSGS